MLSNGINRNKDLIEDSNKEIDTLKTSVKDLEIKSKQIKNEIDNIKNKG